MLQPTQAELLYYQALDQIAANDPAQAVHSLTQAIHLDPGLHDAHHALLRALQDTGRYDEAVSAAQHLIARDPDDPLAHTSLSILYQHQGKIAEAEAEATKAKLLGWKQQLREARQASHPTEP